MTTGRISIVLGALLMCAGASGCASVAGMRELAVTDGDARAFEDTDFDGVIDICRTAARRASLQVLEDAAFRSDTEAAARLGERAWILVCELPGNFWTHHGSKVRLLIIDDKTENVVRICTRRNSGMNITAPADLAPRLWPTIEAEIRSGGAARATDSSPTSEE